MKTFEVELQRTSYITVTVEAEKEDDAEAKAYEQIETRYFSDASWTTESVEEVHE